MSPLASSRSRVTETGPAAAARPVRRSISSRMAGAYAPAILDEIERRTGRAAAAGPVSVTLDRLEAKGLIRSRLEAGGDERGGRPRRYVTVTAAGIRRVRASRAALVA